MSMTTEKVNDKLQYLLGTLRDGEKGFSEAAEHATDASLKQMFQSRSAQRGEMARSIEAQLNQNGQQPKESGSVGAALHRTWLGVRDALTGQDDNAVVAETLRGEDAALKNYQDVLKETDLLGSIRTMVEQQYSQIQASEQEMNSLKQRY